MHAPPRVAVIGGGISGLAAAFELGKRGARVVLLESSPQLGGLGTFFSAGGLDVERFYHCIMPSDNALLGLLHEIGLRDRIQWRHTTMGMFVAKHRYDFNTAVDLLRFRPLPMSARLRLGAATLLLPLLTRGKDLDNVRAEDWLRRCYGEQTWTRLWQPLFRAKFGPAVGDVPALYLSRRLGRESNTATRGYPVGGYRAIIDGLTDAISAHGADLRTSVHVTSVAQEKDAVRVGLSGSSGVVEDLAADYMISTVPLPILQRLTAPDPALAAQVPQQELEYQGVVNVLFFLSRPLRRHYWSPVLESGTDFDGLVEMSELAGTAPYGGRHLVYAVKYTNRTSRLFREDEGDIAARWTDQLLGLYRDLPLRREDVQDVRVFRAPFVEPVYPLGYGRSKPDLRVGESRIYLATSAQVYPQVTSWNSSVALARRVVDHLWQEVALDQATVAEVVS